MTIFIHNGLVLAVPDNDPGQYLLALQLKHLAAHLNQDPKNKDEFVWMSETLEGSE